MRGRIIVQHRLQELLFKRRFLFQARADGLRRL
jgi:hypothetical protein